MDHDDDDIADADDYTPTMVDPLAAVIELCHVASNPKAAEAVLKKLSRAERAAINAEQRCAIASAKLEQKEAAIAEREAAAVAREAALDVRETEFENSLKDAHAMLRQYHDDLAQEDRRIRYHVLSSADLLGGYNPQLQDLPGWPAIRQMVPGLPDDPPPLEREASHPRIDAIADTFSDPTADRHGNAFLGTLTRSISHKAASQ